MVGNSAQGKQLYRRMNDVCNRFLGASIRYLHSIEADELVLQSLRKYKPVLEFAPGSAAARDFRMLAELITQLPPIEQASGRLQFFMGRMLHNTP